MRNKDIENKMYELAVELIKKRYPKGWGGAGVVRTANDNYYTSVALDVFNASCEICIETGAMLEACKYNEKITHCLCVTRDDEASEFKILSPCGICQERLRYYGPDVFVGVTANERLFVKLSTLQPYHWSNAYGDLYKNPYEDGLDD